MTYTVTVRPPPDGGTVSLTDGFGPVNGCAGRTLDNGQLTCTVSYPSTPGQEPADTPFKLWGSSPVTPITGDQRAQLVTVLDRSPVITTTSLPAATQGTDYAVQLEASGAGPFHWTLAYHHFPPGLQLDHDGMLAGTPRRGGTFAFTVRVTYANQPRYHSTTGKLVLAVNP